MTSRLKRKLDDLDDAGVNLNESFCQIGTPLPSLADTKKDKNEFVPLWKQEVRDDQGRQRFHGAFTGGFSAGYYNTVGSKEGFTPSTFISSRTNRAKDQSSSSSSSNNPSSSSRYKQQTAEDFMDEEDLADLRNSRSLENTETFKSVEKGKSADELLGIGGTASLSSSLANLIQPAQSSIGAKMLTKLGWRPGQGIGPRVSSRKLRIQDKKLDPRTAGRVGPGRLGIVGQEGAGGEEGDEIDLTGEEAKKHTFAPRDTRLLVFDNKIGKEGLGYIKGAGMSGPLGRAAPIRSMDPDMDMDVGDGFGLGPDGADEDDADIYENAGGPSAQRGRRGEVERSGRLMAYDEMEVDDGEGIILLGEGTVGARKREKEVRQRVNMDGQIGRKSKTILKPTRSLPNTWNDGRPLIPGFELDPSAITQDKWFEFPSIPAGWTPKPSRVWHKGSRWDKRERGDENTVKNVDSPAGVGMAPVRRVQLTSDQRGEALGEGASKATPTLGPGASVFEYMSSKEKQRLADFLESKKAPPPVDTTSFDSPTSFFGFDMDDLIIPPLSPRTASAALKGFIPFGDDEDKQERYCSYLRSQTLNTKEPIPKLFPSPRADIVNKELSDFSKSAAMFKPISFAMSNRFTSSTVSAQDLVQPKPGLHMPNPDKLEEWNDQSKKAEEPKEILTPRQEAARAGLYGPLTRVVQNWAPNKLLCKRFGVQDPYPDGLPGTSEPASGSGSAAAGTRPLLSAGPNDVSWQDKFIHKPVIETGVEKLPAGGSEPVARQPTMLAEVGLADDVNQGKDILTYEKPPMDIFRAIFANDSDDDEDSEDEEDAPQVTGDLAKKPESTRVASGPQAPPASLISAVPPIASTAEYTPLADSGVPGAGTGKIDFEAYKPTFALRRDVEDDEPVGINKPKSKKEKKRERTKSKVLMSFDVGELDGDKDDADGGGERGEASFRKKEKDKKRKHREKDPNGEKDEGEKRRKKDQIVVPPVAVVEEEDEWVEKEVVIPVLPMSGVEGSRKSGRATAADFMG